MILTTEQVLALAPDSASAAAARKLAHPRDWRNLGRSDIALWGECQGSALYQVRVHLPDATVNCSCPSRKFPCKHALALMLIAAGQTGARRGRRSAVVGGGVAHPAVPDDRAARAEEAKSGHTA